MKIKVRIFNEIRRLRGPFSLFCIAMFFMIASGNDPVIAPIKGTSLENWLHSMHIDSPIIFSLATSVVSGLIVWFAVVYIPEYKKRRILRNNLSYQYKSFRRVSLQIFLWATKEAGSYTKEISYGDKQLDVLDDYREFWSFFRGESKKHGERWFDVADYLQDYKNKHHFQKIIEEMELLEHEIMHVRNNCDIHDKEIDNAFRNLLKRIRHYKKTDGYQEDSYLKYFMLFLWGIFAQWNSDDGEHDEDIIQSIIDKI